MTYWHFDGPKPEKVVSRGQIPDCVLGPEAVWVPHSGFGVTVPEWGTRRSVEGIVHTRADSHQSP